VFLILFQGKSLAVKDFRTIKSEIRVLGVDDGKFAPHTEGSVIVVGVVFRGGCWIDGVIHTNITIDGFDATERIASMINNSPHCKQLRLIMLNGITFAGFNVVNIKKLNFLTNLPVIAITGDKPDLDSIRDALNNLPETGDRWKTILQAGEIYEITSRCKKLYIVLSGISITDAQRIVEMTATRSSFPEPLRVAHIIASGITF
jgi:endonuclease V-like protein UPF0215 family